MKNLRKVCLSAILLIETVMLFGQKKDIIDINSGHRTTRLNIVTDCDIPLVGASCNLILNNTFTPTSSSCYGISYPFNEATNCFSDWTWGSETPQLNVFLPLLAPNVNHASMWSITFSHAESIATRIPPLTPGRKYAISFYRRTKPDYSVTYYPHLDEASIDLLKCTDFDSIHALSTLTSGSLHPLPANSQRVYCEKSINKPNWERVVQTFIANDSYDIIWICPRQHGGISVSEQWWLEFGLFELYDITSFNAGPTPTTVSPNCLAPIGPLMPNCGPSGATYTWHGPNGQIIAAPTNQQIQVNTADPAQVGIWTLQMDVPNVVTTNNTCSNRLDVSASVNVPACALPCAPNVTPIGPIDYYVSLDNFTNGVTLASDKPTGNQWYYNGIPINGATQQTYTVGSPNPITGADSGDYFVKNNDCNSNIVRITFKQYGYGQYGEDLYYFGSKIHPLQSSNYYCYNTTGNFIRQFDLGSQATYAWKFPVYNPTGGTQTITLTPGSASPNSNQAQIDIANPIFNASIGGLTSTYMQGVADLYGRQIIIDFTHFLSPLPYMAPSQSICANRGLYVTNYAGSIYEKLPGESGFDWESYDFGPNGTISSGPGTGQRTVIIPGRGTAQPIRVLFSGPSTITKNFYYNYGGCYKEQYGITIDPGCRTSAEDNLITAIFPNPATSTITISSNSAKINTVVFTDFMNFQIKRIEVRGQKIININITDLKPGIYNCQIVTEKGIENQKLIVR
jgi:hypothetical protein